MNPIVGQPLALNDDQFALVLAGANRVLPQYRSRYLDNVVDRLLARDAVNNEDVREAVDTTLGRMGVKT